MDLKYTAVPFAYLEEMEGLTDTEFGHLMRALLRYSRDGEVIEPIGNERFFAIRVMNQQDIYAERYRTLTQKRSEAGRLGAEAKKMKRLEEALQEDEIKQTAIKNKEKEKEKEEQQQERKEEQQQERTKEQTLTREETELYSKYKAKGMTPTQARVEAAVRRLGMHSNWNDEEECT